jgi:DNA-binding transcriptional ArsR family regulator
MRRRHEGIIRSGALSRLRSEGRLVFGVALCWADYAKCTFRMSVRGAATMSGVHPTTVRRGLTQLIDAGIIEVGPEEVGKRQRYRFRVPTGGHEPCSPRSHSVTTPRSHSVTPPVTPGVRAGHTPSPARAHPVSGARTGCNPYSSIVLNVPQGTIEGGSPGGLLPSVEQPAVDGHG